MWPKDVHEKMPTAAIGNFGRLEIGQGRHCEKVGRLEGWKAGTFGRLKCWKVGKVWQLGKVAMLSII
jgi:hypothetical protein